MPDGPRLPRGAPDALKRFVGCEVDRMQLDLGDMGWIPKPDQVPDVLTPSARVLDGATSTTATIRVGYGDFISIDLPASIVDGQLQVDTANLRFGIGPEVQKWVDAFNRQLRENGKRLDSFETSGDTVTMTKRAVAAGAPGTGAVAPVTTAVPGGTVPPEPEPEPEKSRTGCFAWLAGALAAIAAAIGLTLALTGDDAGDDAITSGNGGVATTSSTTSTTTTEPPAPTTTVQVGQVPPPTDDPPELAVCGNPSAIVAPGDGELFPTAEDLDVLERARRLAQLSAGFAAQGPCAPPPGGYGDCDPTFLPCPDPLELVFVGFGGPGIDHTRSVQDANTGQEGASTAEQLLAMYAVTGDPKYLVLLTSDCGGNLLTGEASLVPNGVTIIENPLLTFGSCTIVDAEVIPEPGADEAFTEALTRQLRGVAVGQTYAVGPDEPDPIPPPGLDALTVAQPGLLAPEGWGDAPATLGNTLAGNRGPDDCFWFFSPDNTELIVKVLDACADRQHYWVFYAATTNVEFEVTVSDTLIGTASHHVNPLGDPFASVGDTQAFATGGPFFDNTIFPCGWGHVAYAACPDGEPAIEAGAFVTVSAAMLGPVPIEGDGAERTHTVDFGPAGGPAYGIAQSADGWSVSSSAGDTRARALFRDNAIMLVAPRDELPDGALSYIWRTTVDGSTVEQPALPVDGLITTPPFPADAPPTTDPVTTDPPTTDPPGTEAPPATEGPGAPTETLDAFYAQLGASIAAGDQGFALDRLHPTVLEAYPTECPAALERFADPDLNIEFVSAGATEPWTWELPDGRSFEIPEATTVTIVLTGRGQPGEPTESHVALVDGQYRWFTFCT